MSGDHGYSIAREDGALVIRRVAEGLSALFSKLLCDSGERVRLLPERSGAGDAFCLGDIAGVRVYEGRHLKARRRKNSNAPSWCAKLQTHAQDDVGPEFRFRSREDAEAFANEVRRELAALLAPGG